MADTKPDPIEESQPPADGQEAAGEGTKESGVARTKRRVLLVVIGVVVFCGIALVLGLGLGLGLKHDNNVDVASPTSTVVPTGTPLPGGGNSTNSTVEAWRRDPREYILNMTWDVTAETTTRHYNFVITRGQGWPDGVVRDMLFINGQFPGPVIEANRGDRLIINVTNLLDEPTSLHMHGIFQNGTNWFDGPTGITQCGIPANQSLVYNITLENQYGTFWYHSHYGTQYLDGILGPVVIHAPEEAETRKLYDNDRVVLLQDWYHDFSTVNLKTYLAPDNENKEPIPDNGLFNGYGFFNCSLYDDNEDANYTCYQNSTWTVFDVEAYTRTRFRFINTGAFTEFVFSVDNHTLSVIEADSTLLAPTTVHRVPIHVAQRYSVIVDANQSTSTNFWIRADMMTNCFTGTNPVLDTTSRAVLSYSGNATIQPDTALSVDWTDALPAHCQDLNAAALSPAVVRTPPAATRMWRVDFSFGIGAYQLDRAKVNGTTWSPLSNTTTLQAAVDGLSANASAWTMDGQIGAFGGDQFVLGVSDAQVDVVDLLVYSLDEGSHPFHLHGHVFWILQTGSGTFDWANYYENIYHSNSTGMTNPMRRDTFTVPPYAWTLIRFVADNAGLWAFHCHVAWHLEAGLMMQFMSRADVLRATTVPSNIRALCPSS